MSYTIEEAINKINQKVIDIYQIFSGHFGEDKVDIQNIATVSGLQEYCQRYEHNTINDTVINNYIHLLECEEKWPFILVHWPEVTVTNEFDKSIVIWDLFAKIDICFNGCIPHYSHGFYLNRSTYNKIQWACGYMHSHISRIPKGDLTRFQDPCLGEGPIRNTLNSLRNTNDEMTWLLFCQELSLYVTVESLQGIPYNKLENVTSYRTGDKIFLGSHQEEIRLDNFPSDSYKEFLKFYLTNGNMKFSFVNGKYTLGMSFADFAVDISNFFIEYYNTNLLESISSDYVTHQLLQPVYIINGCLSINNSAADFNVDDYTGKAVCSFKGEQITLKFNDSNAENCITDVRILKIYNILLPTLCNILTILNYNYGNTKNCKIEGNTIVAKNAIYL